MQSNVIQLRQLLAERFPRLRQSIEPSAERLSASWPTGLAAIDEPLQGGLPRGAITELTGTTTSSGTGWIIGELLRQAHCVHQSAALVDGSDSFDPGFLPSAVLKRLLWVRCCETVQALKAAELLLRDGNLPLVLLDLRLNASLQLRRIPAATWYRLQRIVEGTGTVLFVVTPRPLVHGVQVRLASNRRFALDALTQSREQLARQLRLELARGGHAGEQPANSAPAAEAS